MDSSVPQKIARKIFRSPSLKRRKHATPITERLKLERVLGLTVSCNAAIDCDPRTGIVAYPAGCVIVLQNARKNKQAHIINSSKKSITSLAYSWDGKYIVTGECGHLPNVRVWDAQEKTQVAEFSGHKYGINCVSFSPNLKYVVSVGSQHDMIVNVWDWKNNIKVASNKVSSKVKAISFSSNGNYFVTVGNRHVKFWYLEYSRSTKYKLEAVPLMGRSAILGEQRNNYFCCVSCGRGKMAESTFAITKSGLLCEFNSRRLLDKWVELRTTSANCMSVGDDYIFIGCADGVVRCFSQFNLHFLTTLPKTHHLGVDVSKGLSISHMGSHPPNAKYPDTLAVTYDELNKKVTCIYNDHSVYTWDVKDLKKIGKSFSYLYHSACIWGIEMYPNVSESSKFVLPPGSFVTCSSDDTVRIWNLDQHMASDTVYKRNVYSSDLLKIIYTDDDLAYLCDMDFNPAGSNDKTDTTYDGRNGVRCIRINSDGKHLASGDRSGNIHIHDLQFMDEVCKIEAHDSEVLCLEYSHPSTGHRFLASASRDRLIHVFDVDKEYAFQQTLDDHASSITAVRFLQGQDNLMMLSCGADKSIIFRSAQYHPQMHFSRDRHVVGKTTLYDMDVDVSQKHILTACQDRNIRVFNVNSGKQSKCFKGTYGEDGTLIKVVLDNSGMYVATSSTDKNLSIHDYYSGECVAATSGHSELVTGLKFTNDCKHLISVSGDGCIFVWKLPSQFTHTMQTRLAQLEKHSMAKAKQEIRRQTMTLDKPVKLAPEISMDKKSFLGATPDMLDSNANDIGDALNIPGYRFSVGQLPAWAKKQISDEDSPPTSMGGKKQISPVQPKGRWAQRIDSQDMFTKSTMKTSVFDESVELRQNLTQSADIRRETIILSNKNHEAMEFAPCTDSMKAIKSEVNLREMDFGKVTKRGNLGNPMYKSMATLDISSSRSPNNLTESSSGTSISKMDDFDLVPDTEDHDGDVDSDDSETESTEPESSEVIYYPPPEHGEIDSSFRVQATIEKDTGDFRKKSHLMTQSTDALSSSATEVEDISDDEATTPVDSNRSIMSLMNMSSENLDKIDKREMYMKNNYESLESGQFKDESDDFNEVTLRHPQICNENDVGYNPRHSISAKFLSKSLSTAPSARNSNLANIAIKKSTDYPESKTTKKQELTRALNDTKKKLESLGWKVGSKSVIDLSVMPEKDLEVRDITSPRSQGMTKESMRRACSLTDLSASPSSNATRKRLLPSTPHGRNKNLINSTQNKTRPSNLNLSETKSTRKYGELPSKRLPVPQSPYSRQMSDSGMQEPFYSVSRSISMGSLNDVDTPQNSGRSRVHRVPSVQTLNKMNSKKYERESKIDHTSPSLNKSSSNTNLNRKNPERRRSANSTFELRKAVFETSSSEDKSHQRSRTSNRSRTTSFTDRSRANSANRLSKSDSKGSLASASSKSNLSSRSSSERDLSKIARDVTERLSPSTTVTVAKTKHETYTKRNSTSLTTRKSVTSSVTVSAGQHDSKKELEKSPQELPVKDKEYTRYRAITQDVYSTPLSRDLCDSLAEELRQITSEAMVLFQRVTLDKDLPQSDKNEMMNTLAQGVWQAQQNLRPAVPPLPMYPSTSSTEPTLSPNNLTFGSKTMSSTNSANPLDFIQNLTIPSDKSTGTTDNGTMNLLQQYSDMLLNVIQQRMGPDQSPHK